MWQGLSYREKATSLKFSQNVEFRLFQRPDEAIHRGFDKTTEMDMSKQGNFISNFQPLTRADVKVCVCACMHVCNCLDKTVVISTAVSKQTA
jgi:hypothetical protein